MLIDIVVMVRHEDSVPASKKRRRMAKYTAACVTQMMCHIFPTRNRSMAALSVTFYAVINKHIQNRLALRRRLQSLRDSILSHQH